MFEEETPIGEAEEPLLPRGQEVPEGNRWTPSRASSETDTAETARRTPSPEGSDADSDSSRERRRSTRRIPSTSTRATHSTLELGVSRPEQGGIRKTTTTSAETRSEAGLGERCQCGKYPIKISYVWKLRPHYRQNISDECHNILGKYTQIRVCLDSLQDLWDRKGGQPSSRFEIGEELEDLQKAVRNITHSITDLVTHVFALQAQLDHVSA